MGLPTDRLTEPTLHRAGKSSFGQGRSQGACTRNGDRAEINPIPGDCLVDALNYGRVLPDFDFTKLTSELLTVPLIVTSSRKLLSLILP